MVNYKCERKKIRLQLCSQVDMIGLKEVVIMRESKTMEYKESITNTFLKTVSAYSNYGRGQIKFGITDIGETLGIKEPQKACLNIENKINDSISPKPDFTLEIDQNDIITLTVMEGLNKPYFYKSKAYKRNDSTTIEIEAFELTRLILEGQNKSFESIKAKRQDLTFKELEINLKDDIGIEKISKDILITLELYTEKEGYNNAAELLADDNSFYGVDIARFGNSINIILDRETFERISILDQYKKAMSMYRKYYQYEEIKGALRTKVEKIPEKAFREAIANGLIHRNWDINAHIRIAMFEDRIEITSPGGLPMGMTKEEYLDGQISILRNPIIGNIFFRLHHIERFGTGVKRIKDAYLESEIKPQFEIYDNSIKIILPVLVEKSLLNSDERRVYQVFSNNRKLSSSEIMEITGFGKTKVVKLLNSLEERGYLKVVGRGRGTRYTI